MNGKEDGSGGGWTAGDREKEGSLPRGFSLSNFYSQHLQGRVPSLRGKGLGENISCLFMRLYIAKKYIIFGTFLLERPQVDFMGPQNVSKLLRVPLFDN